MTKVITHENKVITQRKSGFNILLRHNTINTFVSTSHSMEGPYKVLLKTTQNETIMIFQTTQWDE